MIKKSMDNKKPTEKKSIKLKRPKTKSRVLERPKREKRSFPKLFQVKKDGLDTESINILVKLAMGILSIGLVLVVGFFLSQVLGPLGRVLTIAVPFIVALVLAWVIQPFYLFLNERVNRPFVASTISSLTVLVIFGTLVTGIALILGTTVTNEVNLAIRSNDLIVTCIETEGPCNYLTTLIGTPNQATIGDVDANLVGLLGIAGNDIQSIITGILLTVTNWLYYLIIMVTTIIYVLPIMHRASSAIKQAIPKAYRETFSDIYDIGTHAFVDYMSGTLKVSSLVAFVVLMGTLAIVLVVNLIPGNSVGLFMLDGTMQSWINVGLFVVTIALFIGITNIIPFIGPFIGGIPVVLLMFFTENFEVAPYYTIAMAIIILIIQQVDGNILKPLIFGNSAKINAVIILFGLTLFGSLFGIVGFLIATPIMAMIRSIVLYLDELYGLY
jgi:predicted PurR-regulated permease PerM